MSVCMWRHGPWLLFQVFLFTKGSSLLLMVRQLPISSRVDWKIVSFVSVHKLNIMTQLSCNRRDHLSFLFWVKGFWQEHNIPFKISLFPWLFFFFYRLYFSDSASSTVFGLPDWLDPNSFGMLSTYPTQNNY